MSFGRILSHKIKFSNSSSWKVFQHVMPSLIYFLIDLNSSLEKSCTFSGGCCCLISFFSFSFCVFVFEILVSGILFIISCSVCLLFVYTKCPKLYYLVVYPATLVTLFIISMIFLMESSGYFMYNMISSASKVNFIYFISVLSLIDAAKI